MVRLSLVIPNGNGRGKKTSENTKHDKKSDGQFPLRQTPAKQAIIWKAGAKPSKTRATTHIPSSSKSLKKDLDDRALNSIFLIQSLTNKRFGLRKEDLRNMQLHDSFLERKIRALESSRKTPDPKFKMSQGILYHCSPDTNQYVLCVSRNIAEPIAFQLHNGTSFHFPSTHLHLVEEDTLLQRHHADH